MMVWSQGMGSGPSSVTSCWYDSGQVFFLISESSTVCKMGTILYLEDSVSVNWFGEQGRQRYEVGWGSSWEPSVGTQACGSPGSWESRRWVTLPPMVQMGRPRPRAWQERAQTSGPLALRQRAFLSTAVPPDFPQGSGWGAAGGQRAACARPPLRDRCLHRGRQGGQELLRGQGEDPEAVWSPGWGVLKDKGARAGEDRTLS